MLSLLCSLLWQCRPSGAIAHRVPSDVYTYTSTRKILAQIRWNVTVSYNTSLGEVPTSSTVILTLTLLFQRAISVCAADYVHTDVVQPRPSPMTREIVLNYPALASLLKEYSANLSPASLDFADRLLGHLMVQSGLSTSSVTSHRYGSGLTRETRVHLLERELVGAVAKFNRTLLEVESVDYGLVFSYDMHRECPSGPLEPFLCASVAVAAPTLRLYFIHSWDVNRRMRMVSQTLSSAPPSTDTLLLSAIRDLRAMGWLPNRDPYVVYHSLGHTGLTTSLMVLRNPELSVQPSQLELAVSPKAELALTTFLPASSPPNDLTETMPDRVDQPERKNPSLEVLNEYKAVLADLNELPGFQDSTSPLGSLLEMYGLAAPESERDLPIVSNSFSFHKM